MQGTQYGDGIDGGAGQFAGHILGNAGQTEHLDLELLSRCLHGLKVLTAEVLQAENQGLAGRGLFNYLGMACVVSWLRIAVRMKSVRLE
ncbi:MAG: hypothetical protein USCGTAYLOR_00455 [Chromatiales bacterium USCg_Taylor]|nr:MAG: hypothetical protein USCGTAYLOR_00455 [Chromatiales bacterium USCg_Taylor]